MYTIIGILIGVITTYVALSLYNKRKELEKPSNDMTLQYEVRSLSTKIGGLETELQLKQDELVQTKEHLDITNKQLAGEIERNKEILSSKKSSEVRLGQISEQLVPFMIDGIDPRRLRFLGSPIDYICFSDTEIVFLEIKSGASKLSHGQKMIKRLVNEKKVKWMEFRIDGKKK